MRLKLFLLLLALGGMIGGLQQRINLDRTALEPIEDRPFVPPLPQFVKVASLGYHQLVADSYWLRTIQYRERRADERKPPRDLYAMADFVTDLDPNLCLAYYYCGLSLYFTGGDEQQIIDILDKGTEAKACQNYWRNPFLLGVYYYFELNDFKNAAHYMEITCQRKPDDLGKCRLAARIQAQAGEPELGVQLMQQMLDHADNETARLQVQQRLAELIARIQERDLTHGVELYRERHQADPAGLEDLFRDGPIMGTPPSDFPAVTYRQVPEHPLARHRYVLDPATKAVVSDPPLDLTDQVKKSPNPARRAAPPGGLEGEEP